MRFSRIASLSLALLFVLCILYCFVVRSERRDSATCQPAWINSLDLFTRCTWTTLYWRRSCGFPCLYMCVCACVCVWSVAYIGEIGACADIVMLRFISSDILESRDERGLLCSLSETEEMSNADIWWHQNIFKNGDTSDANTGACDKANLMTINVVCKRESALSQYAWQF